MPPGLLVMTGVLFTVTKKLFSSEQVLLWSYIQTVCVAVIGPVITVPERA